MGYVELARVIDEEAIRGRFQVPAGELDERRRRLWAAAEARSQGRGGIAAVARATGLAVETVRKGICELEAGETLPAGRVRRAGGGRKASTDSDPTLLEDLATPLARDHHQPDRRHHHQHRAQGLRTAGLATWGSCEILSAGLATPVCVAIGGELVAAGAVIGWAAYYEDREWFK